MKEIVILTGSTGRLGRIISKDLLEKGFVLVAISRSNENLKNLCKEVGGNEKNFHGLVLDQSKENYLSLIDEFIEKRRLKPYALINNARDKKNLSTDEGGPTSEQWLSEYQLNVISPYELSTHLAERYLSFSRVVNVSSIYGSVAVNPNLYKDGELGTPIHYGVSKAALNHLSKELAVRLASSKVSVNSVSFGGIQGIASEDFRKRYGRLVPQGDMVKEDQVSGVVIFLLGNESEAITGQNILIDGGWTAW